MIFQFLNQWQHYRRLPAVRATLVWLLLILFILMPYWSVSSGAVHIEPDVVTQIISDRLASELNMGYKSDLDYTNREVARDQTLILDIRLPRIILGGLVGMGLALAGVSLQGVFRNPLADPGLIGVTSGAAVGAVTAISSGWTLGNLFGAADGERLAQVLGAFIFGLATTALVYRMAYRQQRTDSTALLLIGLAVNAIATSYVGMVTFTSDQGAAGDITFWTLGDLSGAFWRDVRLMLPFILVGLGGLPFLAHQLNLLALGEAEARYLGVAVERLRVILLVLCALMVGVGVALVGMIGFVGLLVPNGMRILFGPDHRLLLPTSALGGAIFVMSADLFARQVAVPTEIPLGVVTTLVGGPAFLLLILAYRREIY